MKKEIILIGVGHMGLAYAKALQELNQPFIAIGRGKESSEKFKSEIGVMPYVGGYEKWLSETKDKPDTAIVGILEQNLGETTLALLKHGVKNILVEKPGGYTADEIRKVGLEAKKHGARVCVGYNRRFHASTQTAKKLIEQDGGVSSFHFEFTEWGHVIREKVCPQGVKDEWLLHNSTHVIDLAFYLGGTPKKMSSYAAGTLDWHPSGSKYSGSGITEKGATFSYFANWGAPGRWSVEILTSKNRYIFRPLEKLQVQKIGTVAIEEIPIEDEVDKKFKPGVLRQTEAFLNFQTDILPSIDAQVEKLPLFEEIEKGSRS